MGPPMGANGVHPVGRAEARVTLINLAERYWFCDLVAERGCKGTKNIRNLKIFLNKNCTNLKFYAMK